MFLCLRILFLRYNHDKTASHITAFSVFTGLGCTVLHPNLLFIPKMLWTEFPLCFCSFGCVKEPWKWLQIWQGLTQTCQFWCVHNDLQCPTYEWWKPEESGSLTVISYACLSSCSVAEKHFLIDNIVFCIFFALIFCMCK